MTKQYDTGGHSQCSIFILFSKYMCALKFICLLFLLSLGISYQYNGCYVIFRMRFYKSVCTMKRILMNEISDCDKTRKQELGLYWDVKQRAEQWKS